MNVADGRVQQHPQPGSIWKHHSGRLYRVMFVTNTAGDGIKYPYTVVYEGYGATPPNLWSGPLSDWHRRMTFIANRGN